MTIITENEWEIVYIPDKPPIPPHQQPTVDVYAAIIDPKDANALVRKLNKMAPLDNFRHVKRVRRQRLGEKTQLSVILCLACENDQDCIPNNVSELIKLYQLNTFITKVCKFAPLSKEGWEEQCKLWPTSYHPPTYNIDGITGFSEDDSDFVIDCMKSVVHMARFCESQVVNAAIIADPSTKQVIARACDQFFSQTTLSDPSNVETLPSPSNDCNMDENNPNFNTIASSNIATQSDSGVSCLYPWMWAKKKSATILCHPLRHAAMVAIENSSIRDRNLFPCMGAAGVNNHTQMETFQASSTSSPIKRQKVEDKDNQETVADDSHSTSVRPYLCTGYDIFLAWEPCPMCAMALVHQRIRRIFYAFPNPNDGALGSVHRLQGEKSLNHHYAVFRVLLPEKSWKR